MQYITGTREFQIEEPSVVTLGKFDGLHRGHQKLLNEVFRFRERGYKTAVFTFETAPGTLMQGRLQTMITTNGERRDNLERAGIDYLVEYPFNHELAVVEKALDGAREISSTYVREELAAGHIEKANELLGYTYAVHGSVIHGRHLGSTLGFPTVNIEPGSQKHLPAFGVYLSQTVIDGTCRGSITNIGKKPTITGERPAGVETYIYDLNEDLYGKWIEVRLLRFLRPEMKFLNVDELKRQVLNDKETGRRMHGL